VTCDPFNAARVVFCTEAGSLVESTDLGDTISGINWQAHTFGESDIPWFGNLKGQYLAVGKLSFDLVEKDSMLMSMGIGFLKGKLKRLDQGIEADWTWMTKGVEQLVADQIISMPNGNLCLASGDRALFKITNPDEFPTYYMGDAGETINHCTGVDWYAKDPNLIAAVMFQKGSGVSRDGMESFAPFETAPFKDFPDVGGGGEIAIGGPNNFVWIGSNKLGAVYTKDGGESWKPVELPGVDDSDEDRAGLNWGYFLKRHICTADTSTDGIFYIWHPKGIYNSTDGGETWSYVGSSPLDNGTFNAKLRAVPGLAGHLFATAGPLDGQVAQAPFARSRDGGKNWIEVEGIAEVYDFAFGAAAPGKDHPSIWIAGYANEEFGIYRSDDDCKSWIRVGDGYPLGSIDLITAIEGDKKVYDRCYIGFNGSGYAYAPGGKSAGLDPGDVNPETGPRPTIPAYMLPAALMYRFGARWSALKAEHNKFEQELEQVLDQAAKDDPSWSDRLNGVKALWKNL
jgi:hypothetical protein